MIKADEINRKHVALNKWAFVDDYYFMGEVLYSKGIYKDVSECNAGWFKQIGSLI